MRARGLVFALACSLVSCEDSNPKSPPSITLDPSSPVHATGPVHFKATIQNGFGDVSWSLTGQGSLSGTTGSAVVWTPSGSGPATITATALGKTASAEIDFAPPTITTSMIPGLSAPVTVRYDARDIPHVFCAVANDCFAVQGYIQARDRLFPMDFLRRVAEGRVSEMIGTLGIGQDLQLRTIFTTRDGQRLQDQLVLALSPTEKASLDAYTSGVNAYLALLRADPKAQLPGEYAQLPFPMTAADIPDWRDEDTYALARLQQFELSSTLNNELDFGTFAATYGPGAPLADPGKLNAWIRAAAPPTEQTHTLVENMNLLADHRGQSAPLPPATIADWGSALRAAQSTLDPLRSLVATLRAGFGSNNWVVDAMHSANGHAMVANDPHLSLQYPPLFHLIAMTSSNAADNLSLTGGSFPGIPGALVGRGQHVGWGVTVVGYDVTDVYLEQAVPPNLCPAGTPPGTLFCAVFNRRQVPVAIYPQKYMVRVGPGASGLKEANDDLHLGVTPFVLVVPHHGPVIQAPDPRTGKFLTVRWSGHEGNTHDLRGFLGLNTATSVDDGINALTYYATGAQNFVLADDQGNIAYDPHALVPLRPFADPATASPPIPPWFPIPGDGTAEWGPSSDFCAGTGGNAPARTCWISDDKLPHGKNPSWGYLATANADPIGVSDANNPLLPQFQPYLSFNWDDSTGFRHARIVHRLGALTKNGGKVALSDMESIQSDHVSRMGDVYTNILAGIEQASPMGALPPEYHAALQLLKTWQSDGLDCPTGLLGIDPVSSPPDPDPTHNRDSAGCYLFHVFMRILATNVFTDDLAVAHLGVDGVNATKGLIYMLQPTTPMSDQGLCDDVDASGKVVKMHSCAEQAVIALVTAFDLLTVSKGPPPTDWLWGRVHTMQPVSQLQLVTNGYMPGPFARPGGGFTVDVGNPQIDGHSPLFPYFAAGNVRHISVMDPASPHVRMQLPGPQRDTPAGIYNKTPDLLLEWVQNQYFDFAFGSQVGAVTVSVERFLSP
jgi:penicillin amidase